MTKKIYIKGRELPAKRLTRIVICENDAHIMKYKERYLYCNAVVILRMKDGKNHVLSTKNGNKSNLDLWFYNGNDPKEQEIIFANDFLQENWQKIIIYLADADGAFFLFADRAMMNVTGVLKNGRGSEGFREIENLTLNFISAMSDDLAEEIRGFNFFSDGDTNMLEVRS